MRIFGVTVSYCNPEILAHGMTRFLMTSGYNPIYYMVDHLWPIQPKTTSRMVHKVAEMMNAKVVQPEVNLGGHGGFNFAVERINKDHQLDDEDLIIGYDPDSNPLTQDWLKTMIEAMKLKPELDSLSLMHEHILPRPWTIQEVNGIKYAYLPHPEMYNVTIWRYRGIKDGLKGKGFYGHVEMAMYKTGKHAYLYDYRETLCPLQHPQVYNDWKSAHAFRGYAGNFDQYLKENP